MLSFHIIKKLFSMGIINILLIISLSGVLFLVLDGVFEIPGLGASGGSIYVDWKGEGDYTTIQDAIDNANPGETIYVWAGTYYENVIVNKTVTLIGNGTGVTIVNGTGTGSKSVITITANWVNITNFSCRGSGKDIYYASCGGIRLDDVTNCSISYNNCSDNENGITLNTSNSN